MNREEYLRRLRISLHELPIGEIEDILSDYEEHFDIGISKGKTEEEISKELGNPKEVANNYRTTYRTNDNEDSYNTNIHNDTARKLFISLLLIFFNLVIVLGPFLGLVGLLLGLYGACIGVIVGGFIALFGSPLVLLTPIEAPHILTSISFGIAMIGLGALGTILSIYLTKLFYNLTTRYIDWNIKLINK